MHESSDLLSMVCLSCGYDLAGTPESRCPECGTDIDHARWERITGASGEPGTPWEREPSFSTYIATLRKVFSFKLAADLPATTRPTAARSFAWTTLVVGGAPLVLSVGSFEVGFAIALAVGGAVGFVTFNFLMTESLRLAGPPLGVVAESERAFWRAIVRYQSAFMLPVGWISQLSMMRGYMLNILTLLGLLIWTFSVPAAGTSRTPRPDRRFLPYLVAPLILAASLIAKEVATGFLAMLLTTVVLPL